MSPYQLDDVTILTVHYHTPWLLKALYNSIRKYYTLPVIVIDNSTNKKSLDAVKNWSSKVTNTRVIFTRKNIKHGPGLNLGIRNICTPLVCCIDTDVKIKKSGFIERLVGGMKTWSYGAGMVTWVSPKGVSTDPDSKGAMRYLHPHFMLLNIKEYWKYRPAANHGAPMIFAMKDIIRRKHEHKLVNIRGRSYYDHLWRGTVARRRWSQST